MSNYDEKSFDEGFEKPESNRVDFGKPGDVIKGTLVDRRAFNGSFGPTTIYEVIADGGRYHSLDENKQPKAQPTEVVPGERYSFFEKAIFHDDIKKAEVGRKILVRFVEERKSKKNGKNYKYIVCKLGELDPEYDISGSPDIPFDN